ncbi:Pao retrotransposon peptidase family protein, partial [Aphelenchoides avenae]
LGRCTRCLQDLRKDGNREHKCDPKFRTRCWHCSSKGKTARDTDHHPHLCWDKYPSKPKSSTKTGERRQNNVHLLAREDHTDGDESLSDGSEIVDEIASDAESDLNYGLEPPSAGAHVLVTQKEENVMALGTAKRTLMMTAKADVSNVSDKSLKQHCTIFFDCGSSETLITKELATQLGLPVLDRSMTTFHHFGEKKGRSMDTWRVQFDVHLNDGTLMPIEADAVDYLCGSMPTMAYGPGPVAVALELSYKAVNATMEEPQILVGLDYIHEFELTRRIPRLPNGFYVYDSRVGQILCGRGKVVGRQPAARQTISAIVQKDQELQAIERLVQLEALGIESPDQVNEEEAVMVRHRETLKRLPDGRYEVSFPYREEVLQLLRGGVPLHKILATNYRPALARLNSIWKTYLRDNPECRDNYSNAFDIQLSRKIIELVDPHTLSEDERVLVHYLAHHPVFRADKPTQLRIVFDGSARSGPGTRSLNDCLHPGPSLLESLIGILLRSRIASVLIIGDIEKAFLQIGLRPEDRDVTRFLWLKDPAKPPTPDNLLVYRYCRIPFGLNSSPFLLLATIDYHLKRVGTTVSAEIRQNTYSDNVFLLAHSPEEGVEKYKEAKLIFSDMKMNIREFISNCSQFNAAIPEEDRAKQTKESTLGHEWDSQLDAWRFRLPEPNPFKRANEESAQVSY